MVSHPGLRAHGKVLPEHARSHNRALLLRLLFHDGPMSRADLARASGLTRVTVSDLVAALIADGLVSEKGTRDGGRPGKPAVLLDLDRTGLHVVALDLSEPETVRGAVVGLDGTVEARSDRSRPRGGEALLDGVIDLARTLIDEAPARVVGLGIAVPGLVDDAGTVLSAPHLAWTGVRLSTLLSEALDVAVDVRNDANAALLAERTYAGADADVLLVKFGLGVGSGLMSRGEPITGARFAAGEIGHTTVGDGDGPMCACGRTGCLEAWVGVPALTSRIAADGDADRVLAAAGGQLAAVVAPVVAALDVTEVVLAGPPALLAGAFAAAAERGVRERTLPRSADPLRVRLSEQDVDIVLRGAAVGVLASQLGIY